MTDGSPYADALGDRFAALHPALQSYFRALPPGSAGVGEGVFTRLGCANPVARLLLGPVSRLLQRHGAVYAGWAEDVRFTVRNRDRDGRSSERTLHLPGEDWTMRDRVRLLPHGRVVDGLGRPGVLAAVFEVTTDHGALELRSTRVGVRLGTWRIRFPRCIAPRIRLVESADDDLGLQRVALTVDVPLLGRIHEYAGTFRYEVEEEA